MRFYLTVMKTLILLSLLPIFLLSPFTSCFSEDNYNIGIITELSGPFAANGEDCKIGHASAMTAYTEKGLINKKKVNLLYGDSRGEGKTGINELNKLLSGNELLAVLVNRSQVAMPINSISKSKKISLVGVAGHPDFVESNPYAFRLFPSAKYESQAIIRVLTELKVKSIAVISLEDEYLSALKNNVLSDFKSTGGKVLYEDSVIEGESDFTSIASKIAQANAEAVFVNLGLSQTGIMIKKLREQKVKSPLFSNFWVQKKEVIDAAGKENIEGTFFIGVSNQLPGFAKILKSIRADLKPSGVTYSCHAALGFVLQALNGNKGIDNKESLYQELLQLKEFHLIDETIGIENREAVFKFSKFVIKNGEVDS